MNIDAEAEIGRRAERVTREDVEGLLGKEATAERLSKKGRVPVAVLGGHQDVLFADQGLVQRLL